MKLFFLLACCLAISTAKAQNTSNDEEAIKTVCNYYLEGGTNGDSILFSKAFSPGGLMQYMRNDTLVVVSLKDFMSRMPHTLKKTNRNTKIETITIYGNAAMAKLTIEYPTFYFHDMMSLLKTKEGWRIVGKIFYREMKQ